MTVQENQFSSPGRGMRTINDPAERLVRDLLADIDVEVGGSRPFDIQVHDQRFYKRVLAEGSLGFGESFMDGWWDSGDMAELIARIASGGLESKIRRSPKAVWEVVKARLFNLQSRSRSSIVGQDHYDQTLEAYRCMTDQWITLSCGYWKNATTLDEAQTGKLDLICRKIGVKEGDRVLDIGCGFGSFAKYASSTYGCEVVGINISPDQAKQARKACEGLPVTIINCDYRDVETYTRDGNFDKGMSAGMFEHVGYKNLDAYFNAVDTVLKDNGIFCLHTCGSSYSTTHNDPWFDKYIFMNGMLPSIKQIGTAIEHRFVMEDWHNFGYDYSLTLRAWYDNFHNNWTGPKEDEFYRMWKYYLLACAGWFQSRYAQLWQVVLSKKGVPGGYTTVR